MITEEVKKYIDTCVLCWLATSDRNNEPNVSPKEIFTYKDDATLLIANIASPNSVANIKENPQVCVSFVNVFVQKGFKLKGRATLTHSKDADFHEKVQPLLIMATEKFPIKTVIEIKISKVERIQAPSYLLFKETTEQSQTASAMKAYKVRPLH